MDTNLVTQILWGRTTHVGCGWTQFPLKEGTSRFQGIYAEGEYENFFVCNYGVGGNVPGEPVYQMNCSNDTASKGMDWVYAQKNTLYGEKIGQQLDSSNLDI